jgi:very-short-patch-repair endonuclease
MADFGNRKLHWGSRGKVFSNARDLRLNTTEAENILWNAIRNKRLNGTKFRRQHPIGRYIADFYCHEARLIIEVDGEIHNTIDSQEYDKNRSQVLEELDIKVIRFTNFEILNNLDEILIQILLQIQRLVNLPK